MSSLTGKHVLVLGLGESGLAMARWCALRGARLRVADSRAAPPGLDVMRADAPLAEIVTGAFGAEVLEGIELVALSPGLDPRLGVAAEARRRGLAVTGEMSLLAEALVELGVRDETRILAITGTNGKTTTTRLAATMLVAGGLRAAPVGNIGTPVLDAVRDPSGFDVLVVELSSHQLWYLGLQDSPDPLSPHAAATSSAPVRTA